MPIPNHLILSFNESSIIVQERCLAEAWGRSVHSLVLLPPDDILYGTIRDEIRRHQLTGSPATNILSRCGLRNLRFGSVSGRNYAKADIYFKGGHGNHLEFTWRQETGCAEIAATLFMPEGILGELDQCHQVTLMREDPDIPDLLTTLSLDQDPYIEENKIIVTRGDRASEASWRNRLVFFLGFHSR